jgi:hypothetical protein
MSFIGAKSEALAAYSVLDEDSLHRMLISLSVS